MLSTDSPLEINSLYRLRLWGWDHNPKTNERIPIDEVDDFLVLEREEPYKGRFVYLLQYYGSGAKKRLVTQILETTQNLIQTITQEHQKIL